MMTLASLVLAKSPLAGVMFRSHVLNIVSTPIMLVFLFGKPMLFRILWTLSPVKVIVIDESPARAREHVVLRAVHVRRVVVPVVAARRMVRVEARRDVLPGQVVAHDVAHAGLAAAHLEAVAVARRRPRRPRIDVAVAHRPAVLDDDRHLLADQVEAVVGVPPGAAAAVDRGRPGLLVVVAEAVGVLPVALAAVRIVVVVRVDVEDQVAAARRRCRCARSTDRGP